MLRSIREDMPLYEQVYLLLAEEAEQEQFRERRSAPRKAYKTGQLLAPYINGERPRQSDFKLVECNDLSAGGFSFVTEGDESANEFVVALGAAPFQFFVVQVANRRLAPNADNGRILVGCRFTQRFT